MIPGDEFDTLADLIGLNSGGAEWMARAACRGTATPDDWFPDQGGRAMTAKARAVCRGCPVQRECHAYAERGKERHGVWAGRARRGKRARSDAAAWRAGVLSFGAADELPARRRGPVAGDGRAASSVAGDAA